MFVVEVGNAKPAMVKDISTRNVINGKRGNQEFNHLPASMKSYNPKLLQKKVNCFKF